MKKPRSVTPMGRLVTRALLQNVANQITAVVGNGLRQLEEQQDARFARIERALNLPPMPVGPELVPDEPSGLVVNRIGDVTPIAPIEMVDVPPVPA